MCQIENRRKKGFEQNTKAKIHFYAQPKNFFLKLDLVQIFYLKSNEKKKS